MKRLKCVVFFLYVLCSSSICLAKDSAIKIAIISDKSEPTSVEVMNLFREVLQAKQNLFEVVDPHSSSLNLLFQADCMSRRTESDPYVCFYTVAYVGGGIKTFMGGGIQTAKTAGEAANAFVSSVAQDIVEQMNAAMRGNAIESLEACLFLTQSSCAVPNLLVPELTTKTINLSQYLQRGGLKK